MCIYEYDDIVTAAERADENGKADVECSHCGEVWTIEPDADFTCSCGHDRIVAPMIALMEET